MICFHNIISQHYKTQNEENFDINIKKLINFLNKENIEIYCCNNKKIDFNSEIFLSQLMDLKSNEKIINDSLLENINTLLYSEKIKFWKI